MSAIAIIPARGGSTRIPRKNIRRFHGKPIIAYSIEAAFKSGLFDLVIVSTDDNEIAQTVQRITPNPTVLMRDPRLAEDLVGTQEVAKSVLNDFVEMNRSNPYFNEVRFVCCIYATAPLMVADDLEAGFYKLGIRDNRYVYSVGPDGQDAGQWYWGTARTFLDSVPLEANSERYVLPANRVCDINTEDDWYRAEEMYAALFQQRKA